MTTPGGGGKPSNFRARHPRGCQLRFHDLRHTAGLRLANRGVPLQIIQDIMHHKDPRTTRIYTEVDSEVIAEVVDRELQFPE